MSLILGKEYCKIDANGRFKFPVALKRQLQTEDDGRFIIRQSDYFECLELWTYASFYAEIERIKKTLNIYPRRPPFVESPERRQPDRTRQQRPPFDSCRTEV